MEEQTNYRITTITKRNGDKLCFPEVGESQNTMWREKEYFWKYIRKMRDGYDTSYILNEYYAYSEEECEKIITEYKKQIIESRETDFNNEIINYEYKEIK